MIEAVSDGIDTSTQLPAVRALAASLRTEAASGADWKRSNKATNTMFIVLSPGYQLTPNSINILGAAPAAAETSVATNVS
jgi:hypothetical protein